MSDIEREDKPTINASRRRVLKVSALALATAGAYGVAPFFGPWKHNHAWSQAGAEEAAGASVSRWTRAASTRRAAWTSAWAR